MIGTETELREQGACCFFVHAGGLRESRKQAAGRELPALLGDLTEHDARADHACACDEGHSREDRVEQCRLPAPVRTDDCEPIGPRELQVERAELERTTFHHRLLESHDDIAAALLRRKLEPELPRLVRLVEGPEPGDATADRLLHVLRLLLLASLSVAALFPLLHSPQLLVEAGFLSLVGAVGLRLATQGRGPGLLVLAPVAGEFVRTMGPLVELDDSLDRPVEEVTVVRHEDDGT